MSVRPIADADAVAAIVVADSEALTLDVHPAVVAMAVYER